MIKNNLKTVLQLKCNKCGCIGLHACTGSPVVWTEEDKVRLKTALNRIFIKDER